MEFTRLDISGFKSFPEPCSLLFSHELTAIVGPNGCGKSNIVDALRWVMGENAPKQIRGNDMEDVIFAGTEKRPARNIAEVTLHIDHVDYQKTSFPLKQKNILITRTIERQKGSFWRSQQHNLRARDVRILLADLAASHKSHMIVNQGDIGNFIQATPHERKNLLEQAAGIGGLNMRKQESEQKLLAAEKNLARIEDIAQELKQQQKELERQAKHAARYKKLQELIYQSDKQQLSQQWNKIQNNWLEKKRQAQHYEESLFQLENQKRNAHNALATLKPPLETCRQQEDTLRLELEELQLQLQLLVSEQKQAESAQQNALIRLNELKKDRTHLLNVLKDADQALKRAQQSLAEQERQNTASQTRERQNMQKQADELKKTIATYRQKNLAQQQEYAKKQALKHSAEQRLNELTALCLDAEKRLKEKQQQKKNLPEQQDIQALEQACHQSTQQAKKAQDAYDKTHATLLRLQAEYHAICEQEKTLNQLHGQQQDKTISQSIRVDKGYEKALLAAFDDSIDATTEHTESHYWQSHIQPFETDKTPKPSPPPPPCKQFLPC